MKKIFLLCTTAIMMMSFTAPVVIYAQATAPDGGVGSNKVTDSNFQLIPCTGVVVNGKGVECNFNQLIITANRVIKFLLLLAIPLTTGMLIYTGWLYLTANGAPGQIEKAKKMFVPVILGLFWIGASYIVIYTLIDKFVASTPSADPNNPLRQSTIDAIKVLKSN